MKVYTTEDSIEVELPGKYSTRLLWARNDNVKKERCLEIVNHINSGNKNDVFLATVNEYCDAFVLGAIEAYGLTVEGGAGVADESNCYGCSVGYIRTLPIGEAIPSKMKMTSGATIKIAVIKWLIKYGGGNIE